MNYFLDFTIFNIINMKSNYNRKFEQSFLERKKDKYCIYKRCKNYKLRTKQLCRVHMNQDKQNSNYYILFWLLIFVFFMFMLYTVFYTNLYKDSNTYSYTYSYTYSELRNNFDIIYISLSKILYNSTILLDDFIKKSYVNVIEYENQFGEVVNNIINKL